MVVKHDAVFFHLIFVIAVIAFVADIVVVAGKTPRPGETTLERYAVPSLCDVVADFCCDRKSCCCC